MTFPLPDDRLLDESDQFDAIDSPRVTCAIWHRYPSFQNEFRRHHFVIISIIDDIAEFVAASAAERTRGVAAVGPAVWGSRLWVGSRIPAAR